MIDATTQLLVVQTEEVKVAWTESRLPTLIQLVDGTNSTRGVVCYMKITPKVPRYASLPTGTKARSKRELFVA